MNSLDLQQWCWLPRQRSVTPSAVLAWGNVAESLLERLLNMDEERSLQLQVTVSNNTLIVFGQTEMLPWVDGVNYASACEQFPLLWLPTHVEPSIPVELIFLALRRRYGQIPLLIWPGPAAIIPLDRQFPVDRTLLDTMPRGWK